MLFKILRLSILFNLASVAQSGNLPGHDFEETSYIVGVPLATHPQGANPWAVETETRILESLWSPLRENPKVLNVQHLASLNVTQPERTYWEPRWSSPVNLAVDSDRYPPRWMAYGKIEFADPVAASTLLSQWLRAGVIASASVNNLNALSSVESAESLIKPYKERENTWWMKRIRLPDAIAVIGKALTPDVLRRLELEPPIIAVLDSGVDIEHPQLQDRIWKNPSPGNTGCGQDVHGCNTALAGHGELGLPQIEPYGTQEPGESCPNDGQGIPGDLDRNCRHGTHVAGIIVGKGDGENRTAGVCPFCQIMPIRVVTQVQGRGKVPDSAILGAMRYVAQFRRNDKTLVRVLNSSFGKFQRSSWVDSMVQTLARLPGGGILVIGAAGNEESMKRTYPAAFDQAIAVTSIDGDGKKSAFSNFGPWADIAAPGGHDPTSGEEVLSTVPGSETDMAQGTSMAAPMVAGAAGLLVGMYPDMDTQAIRERLLGTASSRLYDDPETRRLYLPTPTRSEDGPVPLLGVGELDILAAIQGKNAEPLGEVASKQRVTPGCGTLGHPGDGRPSSPILLMGFLIAPCLMSVIRGRVWRHRRID